MRTIIFSPAYCLAALTRTLTPMNYFCAKKSIELAKNNPSSILIFSTAYDEYWKEEARQKLFMAQQSKISLKRVRVLKAVKDTHSEINALKKRFHIECIKIIAVFDFYHAPRAHKTLRKLFPNQEIIVHRIKTNQYLQTLEPSWIKGLRAGYKPLWIMWNKLAEVIL